MKRLLLICGLALVFSSAASASGSSVTVNQNPIYWGDSITFSYTTTVANPVIRIFCTDGMNGTINTFLAANGEWVSFEGPANSVFVLTNPYTTPTQGSCRADLGSYNHHGDWKRVAWQQFAVYVS